uniref:Kinesin motor domain-containing protein n=1 Tax=Strongyloides papillosus TaxID=174720 RepID=A0A0N5CFP8_STREA
MVVTAVVIKQPIGQELSCSVCVVPVQEASNVCFNRAFIYRNGPASHTQMKILHRNDAIMSKLREVELPDNIAVI